MGNTSFGRRSGQFSYAISARPAELGGGWNLKLYEGQEEMGGGAYPVVVHNGEAEEWWKDLQDSERAWWMDWLKVNEDQIPPNAANAYAACVRNESLSDAIAEGEEWLATRSQN